MQLTIDDRRTEAQKKTHYLALVGIDKFLTQMSHNFGYPSKTGYSRAAWATDSYEKLNYIFSWLNYRKDIIYIRQEDLRTYKPDSKTFHFSIYLVNDFHEAMKMYNWHNRHNNI